MNGPARAAGRPNRTGHSDPPGRTAPMESCNAATVLVAEDDPEMRNLLDTVLRRGGYRVETVTNGVELLERLDTSLSEEGDPVDLVISDVRMPGLTGLEVLEAVRGRTPRIPVILITAFGDQTLHEAAWLLGAAAVLDKPFDLRDMMSRVRALAPARRTRAVAL